MLDKAEQITIIEAAAAKKRNSPPLSGRRSGGGFILQLFNERRGRFDFHTPIVRLGFGRVARGRTGSNVRTSLHAQDLRLDTFGVR